MKRASQVLIIALIISCCVGIGLSEDIEIPFDGYWKTARGTIIKIEGDQGTCVYTPVKSWKRYVGDIVIRNIRQKDDKWVADEFVLSRRKGSWAEIEWDYQANIIVRRLTFKGTPVLSYYEKTDVASTIPAIYLFDGYWKTARGTIIKIEGDQGTCVYTPVKSWKRYVGDIVIRNIRQKNDKWIADEFVLSGRKGLWAKIEWDYQDNVIVRRLTFKGTPVSSYYEKTDVSSAFPGSYP